MILDFFHEATRKITEILNNAVNLKEIKDYSLDLNFDDYKLDITIYPIGDSEPYTFKYRFERVKTNDKSGHNISNK